MWSNLKEDDAYIVFCGVSAVLGPLALQQLIRVFESGTIDKPLAFTVIVTFMVFCMYIGVMVWGDDGHN